MGTRGVSGSGGLMSISVVISSHGMELITVDLYSMGESIVAKSIPLGEIYLRINDYVSKF
jgi:hypothetical protein